MNVALNSPKFSIDYGREAEVEIARLNAAIADTPAVVSMFPARWLAIKLLETNEELQTRLRMLQGGAALLAEAEKSRTRLPEIYGDDVDTMIADRRYAWINGVVREVVQRPAFWRRWPSWSLC